MVLLFETVHLRIGWVVKTRGAGGGKAGSKNGVKNSKINPESDGGDIRDG